MGRKQKGENGVVPGSEQPPAPEAVKEQVTFGAPVAMVKLVETAEHETIMVISRRGYEPNGLVGNAKFRLPKDGKTPQPGAPLMLVVIESPVVKYPYKPNWTEDDEAVGLEYEMETLATQEIEIKAIEAGFEKFITLLKERNQRDIQQVKGDIAKEKDRQERLAAAREKRDNSDLKAAVAEDKQDKDEMPDEPSDEPEDPDEEEDEEE